MIFMGAFFGADELALSPMPTSVDKITSITIKDVMLDTLFVSKSADEEVTLDVPDQLTDWNFDTVMIAAYDEDTTASNVDWNVDTVSKLLIKRKGKDDFKWTTIEVKEVNDVSDFRISGIDITPTTGEYTYAVVPILSGAEGAYLTTDVDVEVRKLTLIDITGTWATAFTDGSLNTVNSTPISFVETLNSKYPTAVSNTIANYQRISVEGEWYPTEDDCNMNMIDDDSIRVPYIKKFIDFLTNRKTKLLKNVDGRIWLVMIDNGVADNMAEFYKTRKITFTCVEIGDPNSTEDLVVCGLVDIPEEFWN